MMVLSGINTRVFYLLFAILTCLSSLATASPRMDPSKPDNGLESILKAYELGIEGLDESDCAHGDDAVTVVDEDDDVEIVETASCDYEASVCAGIAGLVFNPDNGQCVFPDQVGCSLYDLGFSSPACQDSSAKEGDRIPVTPEDAKSSGVDEDRYFYVCVKETYAKKNAAGKTVHCPTGYIGARLLGCPKGQTFNAETKNCQ